jgi:hypothetical protein
MAVMTEQQMIDAGFTKVASVGELVEIWSGPDPNVVGGTPGPGAPATERPLVQNVMAVRETSTGRRKLVRDLDAVDLLRMILGIAVIIAQFVDLPSLPLTAGQRNGVKQALVALLKDD